MKKQEKSSYIATLLFTLIALVFMVVYNFVTFYKHSASNMLAIGENSLAQETELLNSYLTKGMDVLQVTAITVEYMMQHGATAEEIEEFLLEESKRYKEDIDVNFTGIYGLFNGIYIDGIGWVPDADYVPQERDWYIAAKEAQGKPTIVSPYLDAQTNTIMISVSQQLYDKESVISLDIVLEHIQAITQNINLDNMGYGFIIDKEGLVVAHSDAEEKGKNYLDDAQMNSLLKKIYAENAATFRTEIDGEACTVFTDEIKEDWYVAMIISNTKLYQEIQNIMIQNSIVCIVVFGLIMIFCTMALKKVQWHRKKLENMNVTIMRTLAKTIDAKDRYTNGHSQRVAKYALEIAKRMGKDEETQENIYYAALLHDVGKIRVPDTIINKQSRLTDEEFLYIKLHTTSGFYISKDMEENPMIAKAAKWHHERFDGKGYPNGLVGENIPEVARIIGVADTYDAMTSNRSYRKVMPQEKVLEEIEKGKGTQFDPEIADIMIAMIKEDKEYSMHQVDSQVCNILAIDDELVNLSLIEFILKDEPGYQVYKENNGMDALEHLEEINPDLVLLDIQMPEMDGFEVYEQIRKKSEVPIVFLTGEKSIETIERANALGAVDYIVKPFIPQVLLETLYNILQEKL